MNNLYAVFSDGYHLIDINASSFEEAKQTAAEHSQHFPNPYWTVHKVDPESGCIY